MRYSYPLWLQVCVCGTLYSWNNHQYREKMKDMTIIRSGEKLRIINIIFIKYRNMQRGHALTPDYFSRGFGNMYI